MGTALVVEDCLTDLQIITRCLQQEGIKVLTADSGEEALTKLSTQTPDVIVLDIVLPGRSGFEVCRDIKDATNTKSIPVVICSTKSGEMDKFWGMKQGADAYIGKPIDQAELLRTVKQLIRS